MLAKLNADIVGIQEVVSDEALRTLTQAAGYPYFYNAARAISDPDEIDAIGDWADKVKRYHALSAMAGVDQVAKRGANVAFGGRPQWAAVAAAGGFVP